MYNLHGILQSGGKIETCQVPALKVTRKSNTISQHQNIYKDIMFIQILS